MRFIVSILFFLAGLALIFWAAKPLWVEIATLRTERNSVLSTLSELRSLQNARDGLLSAYNSISKTDLEKLNQMMPISSDTGGILVSLEKIAQDRGVRLKKAEFKIDNDKGVKVIQAANSLFNTINLSIVVSASYDSFKSFLDALEKNTRIMDVTNISFSVGQTNLYEFIIQADAYYSKVATKISNLKDITGIKIDNSFFSDSRFLELQFIPPPSIEIKKGKTNPFVAI